MSHGRLNDILRSYVQTMIQDIALLKTRIVNCKLHQQQIKMSCVESLSEEIRNK